MVSVDWLIAICPGNSERLMNRCQLMNWTSLIGLLIMNDLLFLLLWPHE